jgi:hypothetical protein
MKKRKGKKELDGDFKKYEDELIKLEGDINNLPYYHEYADFKDELMRILEEKDLAKITLKDMWTDREIPGRLKRDKLGGAIAYLDDELKKKANLDEVQRNYRNIAQ